MESIKDLITKAESIIMDIATEPTELCRCKSKIANIPTMEPNVFRPASPMLRERYENFSYWKNSTHGNWLSLSEMEELWSDKPSTYIQIIKNELISCSKNWPNDAYGLFRDNRLSVFAADDNSYERVYLIWLDETDEPELWCYDCNGMARYRNLRDYLQAYIEDDLSAYNKTFL